VNRFHSNDRPSGRSTFARTCRGLFPALAVLAMGLAFSGYLKGQQAKLGSQQNELAHTMNKLVLEDLKKNYYDPKFHGVDVDARFREADARIDQATSFNQVFVDIQWALDGLHDSHTFFLTPPRPTRSEYGWQMQMIGTQCLVTAVKPGSDAEKQGLHAGDTVLTVDNLAVARENIFAMRQFFENLIPQTSLTVSARDPGGNKRILNIKAEIQSRQRHLSVWGENVTNLEEISMAWDLEHKSKAVIVGDNVMVWKMPEFFEAEEIDRQVSQAKKYPTLVLDLRGNPGGAVGSLARVLGGMFDHDVNIATKIDRKGSTTLYVKTRGGRAYTGKLIVLVDSDTASAAEIVARVVQIEKRGVVIGDRTAGAVMEGETFDHKSSPDNTQIVFYGAEIGVGDLVMTDGKRLEGVGVTPDEIVIPTPADLAGQRDPVLARAAVLAGATLTPEAARSLFPTTWESVVE